MKMSYDQGGRSIFQTHDLTYTNDLWNNREETCKVALDSAWGKARFWCDKRKAWCDTDRDNA